MITTFAWTQDNEKVVELFKSAVAKQTKLIAENIGGFGVDTPLLGIREACKEVKTYFGPCVIYKGLTSIFFQLRPGVDVGVFSDPVYRSSVQFKLSTSQVIR